MNASSPGHFDFLLKLESNDVFRIDAKLLFDEIRCDLAAIDRAMTP